MTDITNAPERIRVAQDADGFWTCREAISGSQEYVRADIYDAVLSTLPIAVEGKVKIKNDPDNYLTVGKVQSKIANERNLAASSPGKDGGQEVEAENRALRKIISDAASALPNGAFIHPEASVGFMEGLPKEIALVCSRPQPASTALVERLAKERDDLLAEREALLASRNLQKAVAEGLAEATFGRMTKALVDSDPTDEFLAQVAKELKRARAKFPGDRIMTIALAEEFGELAKAMLDENGETVWKEAVQTAVMAARVAIDGDSSVDEWRAAKGLDNHRLAGRSALSASQSTSREGESR